MPAYHKYWFDEAGTSFPEHTMGIVTLIDMSTSVHQLMGELMHYSAYYLVWVLDASYLHEDDIPPGPHACSQSQFSFSNPSNLADSEG